MIDPPRVPQQGPQQDGFSANDRIMLDSITDLLAQDRPDGLNWPGVARLIRRALSASRIDPAVPSPAEQEPQGVNESKDEARAMESGSARRMGSGGLDRPTSDVGGVPVAPDAPPYEGPRGTYNCPICGWNVPHREHAGEVIEQLCIELTAWKEWWQHVVLMLKSGIRPGCSVSQAKLNCDELVAGRGATRPAPFISPMFDKQPFIPPVPSPGGDTEAPKSCPLCGGKAYATRTVNGTQMFNVGCASCGLELKAAWYRDQDKPTKDILALWNTRAAAVVPSPSPRCQVCESTETVLVPLCRDHLLSSKYAPTVPLSSVAAPSTPEFYAGGTCPCGALIKFADGIGPYCSRTGIDRPCKSADKDPLTPRAEFELAIGMGKALSDLSQACLRGIRNHLPFTSPVNGDPSAVADSRTWQPMTTAPKNATEVLIQFEHRGRIVTRDAHWACDLSGSDQPSFIGWFYWDGSGFTELPTDPLRWMPVPSASSASAAADDQTTTKDLARGDTMGAVARQPYRIDHSGE